MRTSFLSPKKTEKTFSFGNTKPVLIFTADNKPKEKENKKEKETEKEIYFNYNPSFPSPSPIPNFNLNEVKRKFFMDNNNQNIIKENLLTDVRDYTNNNTNNNKNLQQKKDYFEINFLQNGNK
jgi:hypothetical protein